MLSTEPAAPTILPPLLERLRAATELLERIAVDPSVLEELSIEEQRRLFRAVARVYSPDRKERRRMLRSRDASRKAAEVSLDETTLAATGIRTLRRSAVFTTPNVFLLRTRRDVVVSITVSDGSGVGSASPSRCRRRRPSSGRGRRRR